MQGEFKQYIISLYKDIPQEVYEGLLSIFCIGLVVFIAWKGFKTGLRYSATLLLIEYVFLIFCSTVIFRAVSATRQYDFHPFWSYDRPELLVENIMNVFVFVPVGMILGSLLKVKGSWLVALLIGCSISITIEALQFWFMKGFSEVDDVMHNTLGCVIGYIAYKSMSVVSKRLIIVCKNCGNDFI
jgi:glycopeptide antibiotics resistance protein